MLLIKSVLSEKPLKGIKKIIFLSTFFYPILGCAQPIALSDKAASVVEIPNNYGELPHKSLVEKLNPAINCEGVDFYMPKIRYLKEIELQDKQSLLATVCEPGAYQDHRLTYLIFKKDHKTYAHTIGWLEPVYVDKQWKLAPAYIMAGVIKLNENSSQLINLREYVSRWTCGFNAYYNLPLPDDKFIKPNRVEADHDCDNGIRYDGWPEIDVSKMEVLREHPVYELKD